MKYPRWSFFAKILSASHRLTLAKSSILDSFFFLSGFCFTNIHESQDCKGRGGHSINSSLQTLRHQPDNYCRDLTSAHSQQPDANRAPLVSECKSLTTKLRALSDRVLNMLLNNHKYLSNFLEPLMKLFLIPSNKDKYKMAEKILCLKTL